MPNIISLELDNMHKLRGDLKHGSLDDFFRELYKIYNIFEDSPTPQLAYIESEVDLNVARILSFGLSCVKRGEPEEYSKLLLDAEIASMLANGKLSDDESIIKVLIAKEMIKIIQTRDLDSFCTLVSCFCTNGFGFWYDKVTN